MYFIIYRYILVIKYIPKWAPDVKKILHTALNNKAHKTGVVYL